MNENFFNDIPVFDNSWKETINEDKRKINKRENFNIPKIESSHNLKSEENMSINIVTDNKEFKRLHLENTNILDKQFQKKSPDDSYQDYKNVGIIDNIDTVKDHVPYNLFQEFNKKDNFNDSVKNMINPTILSGVFFSRKNINNVQNKIKKGIKDLTGYDIGNQSEEELEIIMRSIYLQFSKNSDCEIQSQISQLNEEVLKYSVKNIYTNVKQYLGYLKTLTDEPDFDKFPKSISTNIKGKKEYRLDTLINFDFPSNMQVKLSKKKRVVIITPMDTETMTDFKNRIETLSSEEQKEIFNIIKKNEDIKYTQNNNGIFLLLNEIDTSTIENIKLFLKYLDDSKKQTQIIEDKLKKLNNIKN